MEIDKMSYVEIMTLVNNNIIKLIKNDEAKWVKQRGKLKKLLELHINLMKKLNDQKPNIKLLNHVDGIKQWRTLNLNKKENMDDKRYGSDVASIMCSLKVKLMTDVYHDMFKTFITQ